MSKRRAFTLIELLVVIAIMAILIAILIPALGAAQHMASRARDQVNVKAISQALTYYAGRHRSNWFPTGSNGGDPDSALQALLQSPSDPLPMATMISPMAPPESVHGAGYWMWSPKSDPANPHLQYNGSYGLLNCHKTDRTGGTAGNGNYEYANNSRSEVPLVANRLYTGGWNMCSDWSITPWWGNVGWGDAHVSWHTWPGVTTNMNGKRRPLRTNAAGILFAGDDLWGEPDGSGAGSTPLPTGGAIFGIPTYGWGLAADGWRPRCPLCRQPPNHDWGLAAEGCTALRR